MNNGSSPLRIFHIALIQDWNIALERGAYRTGSLTSEGFIHMSTGRQLLRTANKYFTGNHDVVLLVINLEKLAAELKYEPIEDGQLFPHLYGELNLDAVQRVLSFKPDDDGSFAWPDVLERGEDER